MINEDRSVEMIPTWEEFLDSDFFYDPDYWYSDDELTFGNNVCPWTSGVFCDNECDDSCTYSWPTADPMEWDSVHGACRCNPYF